MEDLDRLVHPETRGDPTSLLRWTSKSTYKLAEELVRQGYKVSADSVGQPAQAARLLAAGPSKQKEGTRHPDRDDQFRYLDKMARGVLGRGQPAISVDTKKKELVGEFSNGGREWQPKGEPDEVNVHDFIDKELGRAVPYGIYDLANDEGWVSVGESADTSEFAVNSIRAWWQKWAQTATPAPPGCLSPPMPAAPTVTGSGPGNHTWPNWRRELGLEVTVCHYPPGTSKWNKIEHRMFSFITMNWRGTAARFLPHHNRAHLGH